MPVTLPLTDGAATLEFVGSGSDVSSQAFPATGAPSVTLTASVAG